MTKSLLGIIDDMQTLMKEFYSSTGTKMPTTKYKAVITETLQKTVELELPIGSYREALNQVKTAYKNEEIVLSAEDYVDTDFEVEIKE